MCLLGLATRCAAATPAPASCVVLRHSAGWWRHAPSHKHTHHTTECNAPPYRHAVSGGLWCRHGYCILRRASADASTRGSPGVGAAHQARCVCGRRLRPSQHARAGAGSHTRANAGVMPRNGAPPCACVVRTRRTSFHQLGDLRHSYRALPEKNKNPSDNLSSPGADRDRAGGLRAWLTCAVGATPATRGAVRRHGRAQGHCKALPRALLAPLAAPAAPGLVLVSTVHARALRH